MLLFYRFVVVFPVGCSSIQRIERLARQNTFNTSTERKFVVSKINHLQTKIHMICLLGAGGSGKEKKGKILTQLLHCGRMVMSSLIDAAKKTKEKELANSDSIIQGGGLIDDNVVIELFENAVMECHANGHNIIIADGFPRSPGQAKWLISGRVPYSVVLLDIDKQTSLERITKRAHEEGARIDDDAAPERYEIYRDKTLRGFHKIVRSNPKSAIRVDGNQLVLSQICQIIKHLKFRIRGLDIGNIKIQLDNLNSPIRQSIHAIDYPSSPLLTPQASSSRITKIAESYIPNFVSTPPVGAQLSAR